MSFIHDLLKKELAKSKGNVSELSRKLGVNVQTLDRWIMGSEPSAAYVEKVMKAIGGDITRALPGWTPPAEMLTAYASETVVMGEVTAGHAVSISEQPIESGHVMDRTFRDSPYWHYGEGRTIFLRVVGNSMEPTYPAGTLLACRQNRTPMKLIIANTPVILITDDGDTTFKLWQWNRSYDRGFAIPINIDEHDIQVYKEDKIRVQLIVVGAIQYVGNRPPISALNHHLSESATSGPPMILRESDDNQEVAEDSRKYGKK